MKRLILILALFAAAGFTSCISEFARSQEEGGVANGYGFRLRCDIPGSNINTRAVVPAEAGEDEVHSLYLLFFDADGNGFIEYYDASPSGSEPLDMSADIPVNFAPGSRLNHNTSYKILVAANVEPYVGDVGAWLASFNGLSYDEAVMRSKAVVEGSQTDDSNAVSPSSLLMTAATVKNAATEVVEVTLNRAMSRFDVANADTNYELVSASIWNATVSTSLWDASLNDYTQHTKRYYGIKVQNPAGFKGSLYSFGNYIASVEKDDAKTTCLILGLTKKGESGVKYYRVNVNANAMGQYLKRNFVYKVVVNRVLGVGADTEDVAYTSGETLLKITVNNWDLDNEGLVLIDGEDILALPANKIHFTPQGNTNVYEVFSYSPNSASAPFISKKELPKGITATLIGSTLTVTAEASQESGEGYIEISFNNLKGIISISQTGEKAEFLDLNVSLKDIPRFSFVSGHQWPGEVVVTSSGPWKATLFGGFFTFTAGDPSATVKTGQSGETFKLATSSNNMESEPRYGFVIAELESNPDISRVLVLSQAALGQLTITPEQTALRFKADGTTTENNVFAVDADGAEWQFEVAGADADKFVVKRVDNTITVTAAGNPGTTQLKAQVSVCMTAIPSIKKTISISQEAYVLNFDPATVDRVFVYGGSTPDITVTSSDPWTATISTSDGVAATLDRNSGVSGDKFRVSFPNLRTKDITPVATVTVQLVGTDVKKIFTVSQAPVIERELSITTGRPDHYDSWTSASTDYSRRLGRMKIELQNAANFGTNGVVFSGTHSFIAATSSAPANLPTYYSDIFLSNSINATAAQGTAIRAWMQEKGTNVLILTNHYPDQVAAVNSILGTLGYTGMNYGNPIASLCVVNGNASKNKLFEYLLKTGPFTDGITDIGSKISLDNQDDISGVLTKWPDTFIPIIMHPNNAARCVFGIDPTNRIVYLGDPEIFGTGGDSANNWNNADNVKFLQNVCSWIIYATQYGDEFTRMFR